MKMIDVLNMMSKNEIKEGAKLEFGYKTYTYVKDYTHGDDCSFVSKDDDRNELLEDNELITTNFLNSKVELIPPEPKKYLVKFNMRGLKDDFRYLNYYKVIDGIEINGERCTDFAKTHFTKSELESIQPVKEFLDDMQGKFELIEVND